MVAAFLKNPLLHVSALGTTATVHVFELPLDPVVAIDPVEVVDEALQLKHYPFNNT
jgi:hypothetical protein